VNPLTGQPYDYSKMAVLYSPSLKKVAIIPAVLLAEKPEAAVALVDKTPGLACLIVDARNKLIQSKRWPSDWQIRH
jgi:thiamine biosynthesis lipoprotein ApbE